MKKKEVNKAKPILSNRAMCILYSLCALCWLVSGIIDLKRDRTSLIGYLDFGFTGVWIMFAIVYFKRYREEGK